MPVLTISFLTFPSLDIIELSCPCSVFLSVPWLRPKSEGLSRVKNQAKSSRRQARGFLQGAGVTKQEACSHPLLSWPLQRLTAQLPALLHLPFSHQWLFLIRYSVHNPWLFTSVFFFSHVNLMLQTVLTEVQMKPSHNNQN